MRRYASLAKRVPIPQKHNWYGDIINCVESRDWLYRDSNYARSQSNTDTTAQGRKYKLEWVILGKLRNNDDQCDEQCRHHRDEDQNIPEDLFDP